MDAVHQSRGERGPSSKGAERGKAFEGVYGSETIELFLSTSFDRFADRLGVVGVEVGDHVDDRPEHLHLANYMRLCNSVGVVVDETVCDAARAAPAQVGKPPLEQRDLIDSSQAADLVGLFKVLGNDGRLRMLHALARSKELCVSDLAEAVGMRTQAVSNQLQRLTDRRIVCSRREGNRTYYALADPCVPLVLDLALCLIEEASGAGDAGR